MRVLHSRSLIIAAAGLTAIAVGGCGDDAAPKAASTDATATMAQTTATPPASTTATAGPAAGAQDPVIRAAAVTAAQKGGLAIAMTGSTSTAGQDVPVTGTGTIDRKGGRGSFSIKTAIGAQSFTVDEVTIKHDLYLHSQLFEGRLPGHRSWMKIDLAAAARKKGIDLDSLGTTGPSQDPTQALDYLEGASASKKVGSATVRGVPTTKYHVVVDLRRAVTRAATPAARQTIKKLITTMGGTTTIPVDVWVDAQHRIRREHVSYQATIGGKESSFDFTTEFTAFGVPVKAKAPPKSDTIDGIKLLEKVAAAKQG